MKSASKISRFSQGFWALLVILGLGTLCPCLLGAQAVRIGNGDEPQGLDPHLVSGIPASRILAALFEGLVRLDPKTLEVLPAAAQSWSVSDDGTVWTFDLHPRASWSDGRQLTAQDFVFSFRRMLTPSLAASYASNLHVIKGARAYHAGESTDPSTLGVKAIDPQTLEITLEKALPYFLELIQHTAWYPVPEHVIQKWGPVNLPNQEWTRAGRLVGNGPFRLTKWTTNHVIRVEAHPHYHTGPAPLTPALEFFPIANFYTEERAFADQILHVTNNLPSERIPRLISKNDPTLQLSPDFGVYYLSLNTTVPPLNDPRVRRALSHAIDRGSIVRDIRMRGERIATHLSPPVFDHYHPPEGPDYNPQLARELLAEAGFPGGQGFPVLKYLFNTSETHRPIAARIQTYWKDQLGITIELVNRDWKAVLKSRSESDFEILRSGWIGDYHDPITFLDLFTSNSTQNFGGWQNPDYDQALAESFTLINDPEARAAALSRAESILLESSPLIPIFFYNRAYLLSPDLQGWFDNVMNIPPWRTLHLSTRP
ncbi:MAG: peptide ABC transporter substrate-binding protein [Puniceicoccaceae bacterium]